MDMMAYALFIEWLVWLLNRRGGGVFPVLREWGFEFPTIWEWKNIFSGNKQFNNAGNEHNEFLLNLDYKNI